MSATDLQVEFEQQADLVERAEGFGIEVAAHLCGCEACSRTSVLCTASLSSLEQAVKRAEEDLRDARDAAASGCFLPEDGPEWDDPYVEADRVVTELWPRLTEETWSLFAKQDGTRIAGPDTRVMMRQTYLDRARLAGEKPCTTYAHRQPRLRLVVP